MLPLIPTYPDPTGGLGGALLWAAALLIPAAIFVTVVLKTNSAFWPVIPVAIAGCWLHFFFLSTTSLLDCFIRAGLYITVFGSIATSFGAAYPRTDNFRELLWYARWHKPACIATVVCIIISILGIYAQGKF
jgi:hypothetical protein